MSFGPTTLLRIGGKPRPASTGATFERRNPITGEVATRAAAATAADAHAAVDAAAAALPAWSAHRAQASAARCC